MLTPGRKKVYYIIITVCVLASVGFIIFTRQSVPEVKLDFASVKPSPQPQAIPSDKKAYALPQVFPADTKFDLSVFESSAFETLKQPGEFGLGEAELGRDNPFAKY